MDPKDKLTDHEYDGIQEYDNPLPLWWLMIFFATIIFAFMYWLHYEIGGGPSMKVELDQAMKVLAGQHSLVTRPALNEDEIAKRVQDPQLLAAAAANFDGKCAACHGKELQGVVGPNLTDEFWVHGHGKATDIVRVIQKGVADKGMPPWEDLLTVEETVGLAAYILAKQDSKPAQAKPPQGEKVR